MIQFSVWIPSIREPPAKILRVNGDERLSRRLRLRHGIPGEQMAQLAQFARVTGQVVVEENASGPISVRRW
jgi:hypothetical protein